MKKKIIAISIIGMFLLTGFSAVSAEKIQDKSIKKSTVNDKSSLENLPDLEIELVEIWKGHCLIIAKEVAGVAVNDRVSVEWDVCVKKLNGEWYCIGGGGFSIASGFTPNRIIYDFEDCYGNKWDPLVKVEARIWTENNIEEVDDTNNFDTIEFEGKVRTRATQRPFFNFLQNHPILFQLFQRLLKL